ncbi:hypothetical protein NBRC116188_27810 [Oceaniserpentilla sp. 4NH20-0058]|uniref:CobW family GTP-binding protein n=1 Tax=Oceaniserpentilla sp. 4NH20-0058 TaxID=3127660 RepID=UPI003105BE6C
MAMINVHIITGFLGVGKTSCIQELIKHKPDNERWAVLVNEYGQQGIDGALYDSRQVIVKQVAGGCACCAALLPFQTALNELIRFDTPDRIFIEPSGLGHVDNIVKRLLESDYQQRLTLNAVVCVVDPRHLSQPKYRYHELYIRQLFAADKLVANKIDLSSEDDLQLFEQLVSDFKRPSAEIAHGDLSLTEIQVPRIEHQNPMQGIRQQSSSFQSSVIYHQGQNWQIETLIKGLKPFGYARIKGLLIEGEQVIAVNMNEGEEGETRIQYFAKQPMQQDSVIEVIHDGPIDARAIEVLLNESSQHE